MLISFSFPDMRVFVVPAFESQESVSADLNKNELIQLWNSGKIQPFYFKACWKCQRPTNYEEWKRYIFGKSIKYLEKCLQLQTVLN